jgi:hypothetical protein
VPGRDFGSTIEVLSGLSPADNVIVDPPDSLTDGAEVRVVAPHAKEASKDKSS